MSLSAPPLPPRPTNDYEEILTLARSLPRNWGDALSKMRKILLRLTDTERNLLRDLKPHGSSQSYSSAILRDLRAWKAEKDQNGMSTYDVYSRPGSPFSVLLKLVKQLKNDGLPKARYTIWRQTFGPPPFSRQEIFESLREVLFSFDLSACRQLATTPNHQDTDATEVTSSTAGVFYYIIEEYANAKRASERREYETALDAMTQISDTCLKSLESSRWRNEEFKKHRGGGDSYLHYLKPMQLLHDVKPQGVYQDVILTIKLSIATLKPHQYNLFYSTNSDSGTRHGDRPETELKELAMYARRCEDYETHCCCLLIKELGEKALPNGEWEKLWNHWGFKTGLEVEDLYPVHAVYCSPIQYHPTPRNEL